MNCWTSAHFVEIRRVREDVDSTITYVEHFTKSSGTSSFKSGIVMLMGFQMVCQNDANASSISQVHGRICGLAPMNSFFEPP